MFGRGFDGNTIMNPRQFATVAVLLCGTVVLAPVENTGAVSVESSPSPSLSADTDLGGLLQKTATSNVSVANGDLATPAEWVTRTTERLAISDKQEAIVIAALPNSSQMLPAGSPSVQAKASTPDLAPVENTGAVSVESSPSPSLSADTDLGGVLQPTAASNVSVAAAAIWRRPSKGDAHHREAGDLGRAGIDRRRGIARFVADATGRITARAGEGEHA